MTIEKRLAWLEFVVGQLIRAARADGKAIEIPIVLSDEEEQRLQAQGVDLSRPINWTSQYKPRLERRLRELREESDAG